MYYLMAQIIEILFTLSNKKAAFDCYIMVLLLEGTPNQVVKHSFFLGFMHLFLFDPFTQCYIMSHRLNNELHCISKNEDVPQPTTAKKCPRSQKHSDCDSLKNSSKH